MCNALFALFDCRKLDGVTVLTHDYNVECDSSAHQLYSTVSVVVILIFAVGVPLGFFISLKLKLDSYKSVPPSTLYVARRLCDDIGIDGAEALEFIRSIELGQTFGFMMTAYKPEYCYWETVEMFRKVRETLHTLPPAHCLTMAPMCLHYN